MNYQQNIKNSSLRFVINKIAIELISEWLNCAKKKYDNSNIDLISYDKLEVENDLFTCLSNAIESLINDKSMENKSISGWSFGYICGHVQGELNTKWSNQYLIEPSEEFKDIVKLKTIIELIKSDDDMPRKIEIIYDFYLTHKDKAAYKEEETSNNVISLIQNGKLKNVKREKYSNEFKSYFEKLLMNNYMSLFQSYNCICCPDLTKYLNECDVIHVVGNEHFS